jgi:hypothetical protein
MPLTFLGMGFGLGCMVEGCTLFGVADCRSAPNPPLYLKPDHSQPVVPTRSWLQF